MLQNCILAVLASLILLAKQSVCKPVYWVNSLVLEPSDRQANLCRTCHDLVFRVENKLKAHRGESDVYAALENVCDTNHATHPSTGFKKNCEDIRDDYGDGLEDLFLKRITVVENAEKKEKVRARADIICRQTLGLCNIFRSLEMEDFIDEIQPWIHDGRLQVNFGKHEQELAHSGETMADYQRQAEERCLRDLDAADAARKKRRRIKKKRKKKKKKKRRKKANK
eukprot:jgi/Bigna1/91824/estExt_fgenesh1_pg.C_1220012